MASRSEQNPASAVEEGNGGGVYGTYGGREPDPEVNHPSADVKLGEEGYVEFSTGPGPPPARAARKSCRCCYYVGKIKVCCECDDVCLPCLPCTRVVIGASWQTLCITYGLLIFTSLAVFDAVYQEKGAVTKGLLLGIILNGFAFLFLTLSSFSDPGIFPQHDRPKGPNWTYSLQAHSFRPQGTIFCKHSQVLVEEYDHFCPAAGTVIGKKNISFFRMFLFTVMAALIYDLILLTLTFTDSGVLDGSV